MQDYRTGKGIRSKDDEGSLHMFFSPDRVPVGLCDEQIKICIGLYERRRLLAVRLHAVHKRRTHELWQTLLSDDYFLLENMREVYDMIFGTTKLAAKDIAVLQSELATIEYEPIPLPRELTESPMTEERFATGTIILTATLDHLEQSA